MAGPRGILQRSAVRFLVPWLFLAALATLAAFLRMGPQGALALLSVSTLALWLFSANAAFRAERTSESLEQDVSSRVLTLEAKLEGERRETRTLAAVLDGMAEGIWITDETGVVLRHNDALKEMLYAGQALVGQRPLYLV